MLEQLLVGGSTLVPYADVLAATIPGDSRGTFERRAAQVNELLEK